MSILRYARLVLDDVADLRFFSILRYCRRQICTSCTKENTKQRHININIKEQQSTAMIWSLKGTLKLSKTNLAMKCLG
jgi:hypothetical protein